jgi:hypothetical protein
MPLFRRRQELRAMEEAEATGRSFWTDTFSPHVRTKVIYAWGDATDGYVGDLSHAAARIIVKDEGWSSLRLPGNVVTSDLEMFVLKADDAHIPSAIEAMHAVGSELNDGSVSDLIELFEFARDVNSIFREHRVRFELMDGLMVPFESRELHVEVVAPVVTLLGGDRRFSKVEGGYQEALAELSAGRADNAITDASRALQECLLLLGADGHSLGPLVASAKKKGLLGPHDHVLTDGLAKLIDWVNADRTAMGDAHTATSADTDDAWLSLHVVGALILRLTKGPRTI